MLRQRATSIVLVLAGMLSACSSLPPPAESTWQQHRARLAALEHWQFSGKMAIKTATSAESVRISWHQGGQQSHLVLSGPVGWGRATITTDGKTLQLQRNGEQKTLALDDHGALERELGWALPAAQLPYWVKGLPAPGEPIDRQTLKQGRLLELHQAGWVLYYEQYQQVGQLTLPSKIVFEGKSSNGKILLKHWTLDSDSS